MVVMFLYSYEDNHSLFRMICFIIVYVHVEGWLLTNTYNLSNSYLVAQTVITLVEVGPTQK